MQSSALTGMDRTGSIAADIASDIAAVQQIRALPALLKAVVDVTGLRFACVARVTADSWTTCAVLDGLDFGLKPGDQLDVATTLCQEVRDCGAPVVIDHVNEDACYREHLTPRMYGFQSYISMPLKRANGDYFGTLCALDPKPANVSNANVLKMMTAFTDVISAELEAEQRYDESQAALLDERQTAELREQFIAVLGHDLRTPLGAVLTGAEVLLRSDIAPQSRAIAEGIKRSGHRMAALVDDVLDFARGRLSGGIAVDLVETTTLGDHLRHVVAELKQIHPQRAVRCHWGDIGTVRCSPNRLAQIFANLLTNALNYSEPDQPVTVEVFSEQGIFTLSVGNRGTPIAAETIPHLFKPYWRVSSEESSHGGLGLGLYIASEIARSHGGELRVE